jgi:hypothetical protein
MDEILMSMLVGCKLPSISGKVIYTITAVEQGTQVTLESLGRKHPSVLRWGDIERVYRAACSGRRITPTAVDEILENPNNHDSSTMCALVLAMQDPSRVGRL